LDSMINRQDQKKKNNVRDGEKHWGVIVHGTGPVWLEVFQIRCIPPGRIHYRTHGYKGSLLKVREEKNKGNHNGTKVEAGNWECVSALQVLLKPMITYGKGRTRWFPSNNQWVWRDMGSSWARWGHVITWLPYLWAKGRSWVTLQYTYVNSQVPQSGGKKFLFFLTYCNYNGTLKVCQQRISVQNFPLF
jgi:hypothetical protein